MCKQGKILNWFEIPAKDIDRAIKFYSAVLGKEILRKDTPCAKMGILAEGESVTGGAIVQGEHYEPATTGSMLYLRAQVKEALQKVEGHGGQVLVPLTEIEEGYGTYAVIQDSEGNRIGIHEE